MEEHADNFAPGLWLVSIPSIPAEARLGFESEQGAELSAYYHRWAEVSAMEIADARERSLEFVLEPIGRDAAIAFLRHMLSCPELKDSLDRMLA